jgi:hypothetical protein
MYFRAKNILKNNQIPHFQIPLETEHAVIRPRKLMTDTGQAMFIVEGSIEPSQLPKYTTNYILYYVN